MTPDLVVVVEDDTDCLEVYCACLAQAGFTVAQASNGLEALVQIKQLRPASVVLDLLMPRLGGLEALKRIRAFDPSIVVVVVTGATDPELRRQALALGARTVLAKPVEPGALLSALAEAAGRVSETKAAPPVATASRPQVLVVDDEAEVRSLLEDFLALEGYRTRSAQDGVAALRQVLKEAPDLVLLDIDMPRLGGIDALNAIRGLVADAKVIMISGKASLEAAKLALAYGAFDYVTKPFDLDHLSEVIAAALLWKR